MTEFWKAQAAYFSTAPKKCFHTDGQEKITAHQHDRSKGNMITSNCNDSTGSLLKPGKIFVFKKKRMKYFFGTGEFYLVKRH